jgi:hypothetical protein
MTTPHINELREHLMATLASLRDRDNPMEPDRARAVAQVASVLVDTAKVEVDYIKATGQDRSGFLEEPVQISTDSGTAGLPNGISSITRHRLAG